MNKHGAIAVRSAEDGSTAYHASADPGGNYGTLCGLSTDDDLWVSGEAPPRARINCLHCHQVWKAAHAFKSDDFADAAALKNP